MRSESSRVANVRAAWRRGRDDCDEEGRLEVSQQMLFLKHHTPSCGELAGSTNLEAETVPFNTWLQPNQNKISISLRKNSAYVCGNCFLHLCFRSKTCDLMPISLNISLTGYSAHVVMTAANLNQVF